MLTVVWWGSTTHPPFYHGGGLVHSPAIFYGTCHIKTLGRLREWCEIGGRIGVVDLHGSVGGVQVGFFVKGSHLDQFEGALREEGGSRGLYEGRTKGESG